MSVRKIILLLTIIPLLNIPLKTFAHISLVTLPKRDSIQLTIYNSADITLVKEKRTLSLKQGLNKLEFSWANTLIDPTSIFFKSDSDEVELIDLSFLPNIRQSAIWNIQAKETKPYNVEVSFFTSGISWESFYTGTLSKDEKTLELKGYVKVLNHSGEDYENAQTRLIVGKIHILDQISQLARRQYPYGKPEQEKGWHYDEFKEECLVKRKELYRSVREKIGSLEFGMKYPKQIKKEGLSEYFLYTIEGTETIKNQWAKRLPSFSQTDIPVTNLIKYDENKYGRIPIRFLSFKNDKQHNLGKTPLPGGIIKIFKLIDEEKHLDYIGEDDTRYIPIDEKVELNLGIAKGVYIEPKLMQKKSENFVFNIYGDIWGWDEVEKWKIEIKNFRKDSSTIKITRHLKHQYWKLKTSSNIKWKKKDLKTIEFTIDMQPGTKQNIEYTIRYFEGKNREK